MIAGNTDIQQFLSCLHGSELVTTCRRFLDYFLSCLHGSEQYFAKMFTFGLFLSCLHGSEPEQSTPITLSDKEFP